MGNYGDLVVRCVMLIMTHHPHLLSSLLPSDAQSRVLVKDHARL
jgi:hypothetical protein